MSALKKHPPDSWLLAFAVALALTAFASNSVLCRLALAESHIDAASFTLIRLVSGAIFLLALVARKARRSGSINAAGTALPRSWSGLLGGIFLFTYAAAFSWAYLRLDTGTGALVLFACVQLTMLSSAFFSGKRFHWLELLGVAMALCGLAYLVLPTLTQPSMEGFVFMALAGLAWGAYTLVGRGVKDATGATATSFLVAVPFAIGFALWHRDTLFIDSSGVIYALLSGVLASGAGYALWYYCLKYLSIPTAATCQLSVPFIAALGGILFNQEVLTGRFLLALTLVVLGIAVVIHSELVMNRNSSQQKK